VLRLIIFLIFFAVIALFTSQNLETVPVNLIAGPAIDAPLIVIIGISFIAGFAFAMLAVIRRAIRRGGKRNGALADGPRLGM